MTTLTETLAAHLARLRYDDLPPTTVADAKRFMLDTLAVAWAGSSAPGCREARGLLVQDGGRADATVWAYGDRLPASAAAFANSMFAAALDFDSLGEDSPSHVNIVVVPAALALAERAHASGRQFLAALVAGADLMARLGASCEAAGETHKGWFYTSIHGVFGAAAAAAVILQLDAARARHALGIAYSQAAGTQQANVEPSLTKRMQSAFAARGGTFAALLAEQGISAPMSVIDGPYGLYGLYQPGDAARLLDALGERFENGRFSIKKFPSCGCNHTAIEGAMRLAREHALVPEEIERIEVEISPFMDRLVGGAFDPAHDPQVAAQFNIRYSIACAIVRRKLGMAELHDGVIGDPRIRRLVERVHVIVDPANPGRRGPMTLRIWSRGKDVASCTITHVPGSKEAPLADAEIREKCLDCFTLGVTPLSASRAGRLVRRVEALEHVGDMATFFEDI